MKREKKQRTFNNPATRQFPLPSLVGKHFIFPSLVNGPCLVHVTEDNNADLDKGRGGFRVSALKSAFKPFFSVKQRQSKVMLLTPRSTRYRNGKECERGHGIRKPLRKRVFFGTMSPLVYVFASFPSIPSRCPCPVSVSVPLQCHQFVAKRVQFSSIQFHGFNRVTSILQLPAEWKKFSPPHGCFSFLGLVCSCSYSCSCHRMVMVMVVTLMNKSTNRKGENKPQS